ncbi:hypothetical protein [Acetobacter senegalensis]|nr:hypothetical protein [Acetobacter senegalensis]
MDSSPDKKPALSAVTSHSSAPLPLAVRPFRRWAVFLRWTV